MRLAGYTHRAEHGAGVLLGEEIVPFTSLGRPPGTSVKRVLSELGESAPGAGGRVGLGEVELRQPSPARRRSSASGLNYRDHAGVTARAGRKAPVRLGSTGKSSGERQSSRR